MSTLQPAVLTPRPFDSDSLASGPINCLAGQETSLISIRTSNGCFPYILSRAYFVGAAASGLCQFRVYVGGVLAGIIKQNRNTSLGSIGNPTPEGKPYRVPPNTQVEIRFFNGDAVAYADVECDGEVGYFRDKLV